MGKLFSYEISKIKKDMQVHSKVIATARWQGTDISNKPEMATHELRHVLLRADMPLTELKYYRDTIQPNIPWADDHFEERVCGQPINPGVQWKHWPYAHSAEKFLVDGKFNHNYMERYWPKYAGHTPTGEIFTPEFNVNSAECRAMTEYVRENWSVREGIYHPYGDLNDVVKLLARDPTTRQAYLPVFFPEDTGAVHGSRLPCSLGYLFLMRDGKLDVEYTIRSCDFLRHFRDDIYLTVRLTLWVIEQCAKINPVWATVKPGEFVMLIGSLHMFVNDWREMFR